MITALILALFTSQPCAQHADRQSWQPIGDARCELNVAVISRKEAREWRT